MYDSVVSFLKSLSASSPLLWALLVVVVIGSAGLVLYTFWELVLRWVPRVFGSGAKKG